MNNKELAIQLEDINYSDKNPNNNSFNTQKLNQAGDIAESTENIGGEQNKQLKKKKWSTPREASINLFKGYIGSGILALPYAFDEAGYVLSTIVFLIIAVTIYYTMGLLFEIADKNSKPGEGYVELAQRLTGAKGLFLIKVMLIMFQVGCCVSYVIFFVKFFEFAFGTTSSDTLDDMLYLCLALAIILPMSVVNDIAVFSKASIVGNAFVISTLILIFIYDFYTIAGGGNIDHHIARNLKDTDDFTRIPMIIGVSIYAFEAVGLVFSIRNSLKNTDEFKKIFRNINILICILYASFACCGVIAMGHDMNEIILFSLPKKWFIKIFQIAYAVALILSYPLQLLPSLQIMEASPKLKKYIKMGDKGWRLRQFWSRFGVTMIIVWSAYFIPRFAVFLNMIGSIAGTGLQFFFPIVMYTKMFQGEISKQKQILNYTILVFGFIGGMCGFVFSVEELFNKKEGD